jgi:uracil-DNA glycosylase
VGTLKRTRWHGREVDVIALPHPSGASPWHRVEPGKRLLQKALGKLAAHEAMREALHSGQAKRMRSR